MTTAVGAVVFGEFRAHFGRRVMYGVEAALVVVEALVPARAPGYAALFAGGCLCASASAATPSSAVIVSKFSHRSLGAGS